MAVVTGVSATGGEPHGSRVSGYSQLYQRAPFPKFTPLKEYKRTALSAEAK